MQYEVALSYTLNGGEPIWQVWDEEGCLVFVTDSKTEAEEWIDQQAALPSPTTYPAESKSAG